MKVNDMTLLRQLIAGYGFIVKLDAVIKENFAGLGYGEMTCL